jgi:hypothetical protein
VCVDDGWFKQPHLARVALIGDLLHGRIDHRVPVSLSSNSTINRLPTSASSVVFVLKEPSISPLDGV